MVDGVTVERAIPDALARGLVDVPLYISSVRNEQALPANATIDAWTWDDLQQYFTQTFAAYPHNVGAALAKLYGKGAPYHAPTAGQSYYDFVSDASVTCGTHAIADKAASGFQSPVYLVGKRARTWSAAAAAAAWSRGRTLFCPCTC